MSDETSMSVADASKHARKNPHDAAEAIQTLFDYVEDGSSKASQTDNSIDATQESRHPSTSSRMALTATRTLAVTPRRKRWRTDGTTIPLETGADSPRDRLTYRGSSQIAWTDNTRSA